MTHLARQSARESERERERRWAGVQVPASSEEGSDARPIVRSSQVHVAAVQLRRDPWCFGGFERRGGVCKQDS
jgi:hypothetical protein